MSFAIPNAFVDQFSDINIEATSCPNKCDQNTHKWTSVFQRIANDLGDSAEFMGLFSALSTNLERVLFCIGNESANRAIDAHIESFSKSISCVCDRKNSDKAATFRAKGNEAFASHQFLKAVRFYTNALIFAPEKEEAPLVYGNRSAAFFYMEQYENAIDDIDRAIELGYAELKPVAKLLIRKVECLFHLGRTVEAKKLLNSDQPGVPQQGTPDGTSWARLKKSSSITNRKTTKLSVDLSKYQDPANITPALVAKKKFTPHEKLPWLNAKVDLRYDEKKGLF